MTSRPAPRFSLIVPTLNRLDDVRKLFVSIQQSTFQDFEVIIIDQNSGPLLDDLCSEFKSAFALRQEKITPTGVSHARNHGFQFATGEIINFPDDDCELTPDLLQRVSDHFAQAPALDMLFARAVDREFGKSSVTRFSEQPQPVTPSNIYSTTVEFTMFLRRQVFVEVGRFDERLGVGKYYGAEEGADFVLRALYQGRQARFDPAQLFYHAQKIGRYDAKEFARAYSYSRGFGGLTVKHLLAHRKLGAALRFLHFQLRAACGVLLFAARFNFPKSRYYLVIICGRMAGALHALRDMRPHRCADPPANPQA